MTVSVIDKVGLAVIRDRKLLLVRNAGTTKLLIPGGRREDNETDAEVLAREIREELACDIVMPSLLFMAVYSDVAANDPGRTVTIRLYLGELTGTLVPSAEVAEVVWFDPVVDDASRLSPIVRHQIVPHLVSRGFLRAD